MLGSGQKNRVGERKIHIKEKPQNKTNMDQVNQPCMESNTPTKKIGYVGLLNAIFFFIGLNTFQ